MTIKNEKESSFLTSTEIDSIVKWISIMNIDPSSLPKEKIKLAERTLKLPYNILGYGLNRMVYDLGNGYVLKVALSELGLICNTHEFNLYQNSDPDIRQYLCPVMELGQGWNVMKKMDRKVPITIENLRRFSELTMKFLLRGIVPADLRLANIALTDDNQMVVIDYGLFI